MTLRDGLRDRGAADGRGQSQLVAARQEHARRIMDRPRGSLVVGLDTGLTHLAAALGAPTVGIYCGSDPARTGLYGAARARNVGAPFRRAKSASTKLVRTVISRP